MWSFLYIIIWNKQPNIGDKVIIKHKIIDFNGDKVLILFLDLNYEFAGFKNNKKELKAEINDYIKNNNLKFNNKVMIAMGGIILASLIYVNNDLSFNKFENDKILKYTDNNLVTIVSKNIEPTKVKTTSTENKEKNNSNVSQNNTIPKANTNPSKKSNNDNNSNKQVNQKKNTTQSNQSKSNSKTNSAKDTSTKEEKKQIVSVHRKNGNVINLELEEYVIGVVAAEAPASFNIEALKSQAVVTRTYALKAIKSNKKLTDTVSTQAYIDTTQMKSKWGNEYDKYYNKIKRAVNETKGMYIVYNNQIIDSVYHSTSNGYTEDASRVWGHTVPYLKSVESKWDINTSGYKRTVEIEFNQLNKIFGISNLDQISIISRNSTGRVDKLKIGDEEYSAVDFRELLGLRSTDFDIKIDNNKLSITTKGYGHGVGLSQYGSNGMAKEGYTYDQIIKHYYTGVNIVKLNWNRQYSWFLFFIILLVIVLKIYFDLVFIINFIFDFLLLLSVSYILKRNASIKRILFGSFVGSISIFLLFIKLDNFTLFIYKIFISILMILSTFSFKNFKYFISNITYLYISSIILGGGLYLLNNQFSYKNNGLLFSSNKFELNIIFLLIASPVIIYFYLKQLKLLKTKYNNYYKVELFLNNKKYLFTAFLDTGNKLKDPYKKRPIILVNTDKIKFSYEDCILVPYETVSGNGILKCLVVDKIVIDNKHVIIKPLIGLSNQMFKIEGINMLLNSQTLEGEI